MATSVKVALQKLNNTVYSRSKLFLTVDPAFNIGGNSPFFLEGKIRSISFGINEHIGIANVEYPDRPFGTSIGTFVIPTAIYVNNTDNYAYRGFFVEEQGILDSNNDQVNAIIYDYKWFMSKLSKIKGKIYTVDNNIFPDATPGNVRIFGDESLYEKFRYVIPGLNKVPNDISNTFSSRFGTGYIGTLKTIFNENGDPDCAADTYSKNCVFILDPDLEFKREHNARRRSNVRYFFNYASMLMYVVRNYLSNVFSGSVGTTKILISTTGLSNIMRFGLKYGMATIRPSHFDINNLSPLEAIDKIVKAIPGSWYWRLLYFPNSVVIDIQNNSEPEFYLPGKSLFIGDGGKLNNKTNNNVNVAKVTILKSVKNSISHALAVGGPIDVETSIQFIPGWPQYVRPLTDLDPGTTDFGAEIETVWDGGTISQDSYVSDFKGIADYRKWKASILNDTRSPGKASQKLRDEVSTIDQKRYAQIYRYYVFPENQFQITRYPSVALADLLEGYNKYATYLDQLFFRYLLRPRKVKGPITQYREILKYASFTNNYTVDNVKQEVRNKYKEDPVFVFMYDELIGSTLLNETGGVSSTRVAALLKAKKWIIPQEDKGNSYSIEKDNKVIIFQRPQYQRPTVSFTRLEDEAIPTFKEIVSRKVFASCRIECDVPLIKDKIANRHIYSNARLVAQDINEDLKAVVRVNAFYPNPATFVGEDMTYSEESDADMVGDLTANGASTSDDAEVGAKLIDWNRIGVTGDVPKGVLMVDDMPLLDQVLRFLLDSRPVWEIIGNVDMGRIDTSFLVGDRIDRIIGSELADGSGGYYNLGCVIEKMDYSVVDENSDLFTSTMSFRNSLHFNTYLTGKDRQLSPK